MPNLEKIRKSISSMSDAELRDTLNSIRSRRYTAVDNVRNKLKKEEKDKRYKKEASKLDKFELRHLIEALEDEKSNIDEMLNTIF